MSASARRPALFDVRLGNDIHVLMACGLGGTSLINANVCLSPDRARVRGSPPGRGEVRRDRLLAEGFVRARHMLRPEPSPRHGRLREGGGAAPRRVGVRAQRAADPAARRLQERPQRRRRAPGSLHRVRRLLRRLQRRRQDDGRLDLSRRRRGVRRRDLHRHARAVASPRTRRHGWRVWAAAG